TPPAEGNWMVHSYYQYIVRREDAFPVARDEIVRILNEEGIGCRPSYPMPLYKQKALQDLRIRGRCPVAEDLIPRLFELPVHPGIGPQDIDRILDAIGRLARSRQPNGKGHAERSHRRTRWRASIAPPPRKPSTRPTNASTISDARQRRPTP